MRELTRHQINACNRAITIATPPHGVDDEGRYYGVMVEDDILTIFRFQSGWTKERGTNGLTNECLLAILIDRLEISQAGAMKCRENEEVLLLMERALHILAGRARRLAGHSQSWKDPEEPE